MTVSSGVKGHEDFIWSVADLLRGNFRPAEYRDVMLPLIVLRRLDCVLEPTKDAVREEYGRMSGKLHNLDPLLFGITGVEFYNTSHLTLKRVLDDPANLADQLLAYINGFSADARDVMEKFDFRNTIRRLERSNLLYHVLARFCELDLHPSRVSNVDMGTIYEELIRKFSELSNETAGEHFTPREVIRLMVNLLFIEDRDLMNRSGIVKTLYDPACGTGGMLSVSEDYLRERNPDATLLVYGQELNEQTYAICRSDLMLKNQRASKIYFGNSFTEDGTAGQRFDYMLANPPFGVEWKMVRDAIEREHEKEGFAGRFGAGLPRINDGSFLFLQHMLSKMKPVEEGGSRLAIVFNGSPLFTGGAGSGESEIRRWIIENDWLEAVVALPDQLFYNTGISTYFWVLTNRKSERRRGLVQLVDARELFVKMRKSLGDKRKAISEEQIADITSLYEAMEEGDRVKVFPNHAFGYQRITVERPLRLKSLDGYSGGVTPAQLKTVLGTAERDRDGAAVTDRRGNPYPDPDLRDSESVALPAIPLKFEEDAAQRLTSLEYRTAVADYMAAEVLPYASDAWVDHSKTKLGYELPITRYFYQYVPPRPLAAIDDDIRHLEHEIHELLNLVLR